MRETYPVDHKINDYRKLIKEHKDRISLARPLENILNTLISTELPHPLTTNLSQLVEKDVTAAVDLLKKVDCISLREQIAQLDPIVDQLQKKISETFKKNGRLFIVGCGAAARAAALVELLFGEAFPHLKNRVVAIIAGGDVALIKSREGFEDSDKAAVAELRDHKINPALDRIIGVTASGSARFVHAAIAEVVKDEKSDSAILLACITADEMTEKFLNHSILTPAILKKVELTSIPAGRMILTGSTRGPAANSQIMTLILSCFAAVTGQRISIKSCSEAIAKQLEAVPSLMITEWVNLAAKIYKENEQIYYHTKTSPFTLLTNEVELHPTFNIDPYENDLQSAEEKKKSHSTSRIIIDDAKDSAHALLLLTTREPRPLSDSKEWPSPGVGLNELLGFDLSSQIQSKRRQYINTQEHNFYINIEKNKLILKTDRQYVIDLIHFVHLPKMLQKFAQEVFLKIILNLESTLVMGLLKKYHGNIMTSVRPTNLKLIDRCIALTIFGLSEMIKNPEKYHLPPSLLRAITVHEVASVIYEQMKNLQTNTSVVMMAQQELFNRYQFRVNYYSFYHPLTLTQLLNRTTISSILTNDKEKKGIDAQPSNEKSKGASFSF